MAPETRQSQDGFPPAEHDHARCISEAMAQARSVCTEQGLRFTPLRARVLEIVWQSQRPLGAYAILEVLAGEGRSPAPPTVYRALDFLLDHGLVHRLASLNAYIGCTRPGHRGTGQFLICRDCGTAAELNDARIERAVTRGAAAEGFAVDDHMIEVSGRCQNCGS